jgi:hypothetical protein
MGRKTNEKLHRGLGRHPHSRVSGSSARLMRRRPNREQPSRRINGGLFLWRPRRKPYRHDGSDEAVDPADVFGYWAGVLGAVRLR